MRFGKSKKMENVFNGICGNGGTRKGIGHILGYAKNINAYLLNMFKLNACFLVI